MKIQFVTTDNTIFFELGRDNAAQPLIRLRENLEKLGHEIFVEVTNDFPNRDCYIVLDTHFLYSNKIDYLNLFIYCKLKGFKILHFLDVLNSKELKNKMILTILEPPSVLMSNFDLNLHDDIRYIMTWKKTLIDNKKYYYLQSPYTEFSWDAKNTRFNDRKLLVDISSNKFSSHPDELYTYRRKLIHFFDKNYPNDFDLYGYGWNSFVGISKKYIFSNILNYKKISTYRGIAKSKNEIYNKYKFVICIENVKNIDDYISQRLFDVLYANTVPVYLGARNIKEYLPENCFIDCSNFDSYDELYNYLISINEIKYNEYQNNIKVFLASDNFSHFKSSFFCEQIIERVNSI